MSDWKAEVRKRVERAEIRAEREAEIVEELTQHLDDRYRQLRASGTDEGTARATTLHELDQSDWMTLQLRSTEPAARPAIGFGLRGDVRYALRAFRRSPGFAAFVILTLALGIGANTAVFTIVNTLLLNPLPVREPSRLVAIETTGTIGRSGRPVQVIPYSNLQDIAGRNQVFDGMAGYSNVNAVRIAREGGTERVFAECVTSQFFEVLGLRPWRGRFFQPEEDRPGSRPAIVLSYKAWQQRFGGDPDIIGRTLRLNGTEEATVVGVAPEGFRGITVVFGPDMWMPASSLERLAPQQRGVLSDRTQSMFRVAARLKTGITMQQAEANVRVIDSALRRQYRELTQNARVSLLPITIAAQGDFAQPLVQGSLLLLIVVGLVLLICCSNAASLFLARASGRRQEIAVRLALGATRWRLIRQLLTECTLLALAAGALGLSIAWQGCNLLWSLRPPEVALNFVDPKLDGLVVLFALGASLVTAVVFGLAPALQASQPQVIDAIKEEARSAGRTRSRVAFRNLLLVGQVAFSLVALITAALFLRGVGRAYGIDPGYQTAHLGIVMANQGQAGYDAIRADTFYKDVKRRLAAVPGVTVVTWASIMPLWNNPSRPIVIAGDEERRRQDTAPMVAATIDTGYFATTGIPLTAGRDFTDFDTSTSPAVAIVNQAMADRMWPGQNPIGRRFHFYGEPQLREIVGVARTANYSRLGEAPQPCVYVPLAQNFSTGMLLYVRTQRDAASVMAEVQRTLLNIDPKLDVSDARTGSKVLDQALFAPRIIVGLLGVFGLLGLALASIGLYGIVAYSMGQRRREIGVRVALGASESAVRRLVVGQGMRLVGLGLGLGCGIAFLIGRGISGMLYGVNAADPVSYLAALAVLAGVAFVACYLPARRASRTDPIAALRDE